MTQKLKFSIDRVETLWEEEKMLGTNNVFQWPLSQGRSKSGLCGKCQRDPIFLEVCNCNSFEHNFGGK